MALSREYRSDLRCWTRQGCRHSALCHIKHTTRRPPVTQTVSQPQHHTGQAVTLTLKHHVGQIPVWGKSKFLIFTSKILLLLLTYAFCLEMHWTMTMQNWCLHAITLRPVHQKRNVETPKMSTQLETRNIKTSNRSAVARPNHTNKHTSENTRNWI